MGEQHAQLLLDTGTIDHLFINAATYRRLGIPIRVPPFAQAQGQANRLATSIAVDPTEFVETPLGTPEPRVDIAIPSQMLTPITYDDRESGFPY